jgi:Tol biopolymer transport system component
VLAYRPTSSIAAKQLAWFDRSGNRGDSVGEAGNINTVSLSADGGRLLASRVDAAGKNGDLWIYELARGTSTRFTFDPRFDWAGVWSPDGKEITFASDRSGKNELYRKASNGAGPEMPLVSAPSGIYAQGWSPDGRFLLYSLSRSTFDLAIFRAVDGKSEDYLRTEFSESQAQFSPDGKFVAYTSNASGRNEIYVQTFPNPESGKWMISRDGGNQPRWRRDGRELFFVSADSKMMAAEVSITGGFSVGKTKALFQAPLSGSVQANNVFRYDVTADGQRFLINSEPNVAQATIRMVLGWEALLTR